MNKNQFDELLHEVFGELKDSGLEVSSNVYVSMLKLFSDYKLNDQIKNEAVERSIHWYQKFQEATKRIDYLESQLKQKGRRREAKQRTS